MSPLRAGYLQCAKNTLWNVQQSNTRKVVKPASNQLLNISYKLEILLDVGSNENFYYLDGNNLGVRSWRYCKCETRGDIEWCDLKKTFDNQ